MSTYKEVIRAFFDLREARSRFDRSWKFYAGDIRYSYRDKDIATMVIDKKLLLLQCQCRVDNTLFKRYVEIARILKERYGIDIEFKLIHVDKQLSDLLCRIGNTTYVLHGEVALNLETKTVEYKYKAPIVYLSNESVEPIIDIKVGKGFVLTIGMVGNDMVVKFTKYNMEYLKKFDIHSDPRYRDFYVHWLAMYWIPLNENIDHIKSIVFNMSMSAHDRLEATLKLLGYG